MKCDVCGEQATVHIRELQDDGSSLVRQLCREHAIEAGLPVPTDAQSAIAMVSRLRTLASFIRTNDRMPRPDEIPQLGAFGDLTGTLPGTAIFERQVTYLEECATFIENNGRYPTDQEMPDPF